MKKLTLFFLILSLNLKSQSLFLEPKNFGNFIYDLKLKYSQTEILIDSVSNNLIYFNIKKELVQN